ncbi:MAG: transcription elongation factor GreA [Actinomycetaceae bacterium]|nr:transcription elongation factor GreA [Actinomycetaceae bacterium]MDY6083559.1 transcription elongation factor GreA [Actinomycetaceae bacterium]
MSDEDEEKTTWLSPKAFERLNKELEERTTTIRNEIGQKIKEARAEGDLSENGGYQAAREAQGKNEGRIEEIQYLLEHARVSAPPAADKVAAGTIVTAEIAGDEERFLIASRDGLGDDLDIEVYPESAPLGQSILGLTVGEEASYKTPHGKTIPVKIVKIEPYEG